jgi:hypothetical protein
MRGYTIATTAFALGTNSKWVDNILSHYRVPGVKQSHQGISRTVSFEAVRVLALALQLADRFPNAAAEALELARAVISDSGGVVQLSPALVLTADLAGLDEWLTKRLALAVEAAPIPRRGRPRTRDR